MKHLVSTLLVAGAISAGMSMWSFVPRSPEALASGGKKTGIAMKGPEVSTELPSAGKPEYLSCVELPAFNTSLVRISGDPGSGLQIAGGKGEWGSVVRHHYSRDQAWNSNNSLIALQNNGTPKQLYLDGETYQVKFGACASYKPGDDRWHPSPAHPNERINVKGAELSWFDVAACTTTRAWSLPFAVRNMGGGKGSPTMDGRFLALNDDTRMFVVDMDPRPPFPPYPASRVGPPVETSDCGLAEGCKMTSATISPSGKYVVVHYRGDHERIYDVDTKTLELKPRAMVRSYQGCGGDPARGFIYDLGHEDMALNPFDHDEDVIIGQEKCKNHGKKVDGKLIGGVVMVRLRDGGITPLTDPAGEAYPHHVSAQNTDLPGWVYVGYFPADKPKLFNDEIVAVKMDGSKAVRRFCQKRSITKGCYRCESHAVPSRDGKRVLFASNWGDPSGNIQTYVVDSRQGICSRKGVPSVGSRSNPEPVLDNSRGARKRR